MLTVSFGVTISLRGGYCAVVIELVLCDTALELVERAQVEKPKLSAPSGLSYKPGIAFPQPHTWHTLHLPPENHPENQLIILPCTARLYALGYSLAL